MANIQDNNEIITNTTTITTTAAYDGAAVTSCIPVRLFVDYRPNAPTNRLPALTSLYEREGSGLRAPRRRAEKTHQTTFVFLSFIRCLPSEPDFLGYIICCIIRLYVTKCDNFSFHQNFRARISVNTRPQYVVLIVVLKTARALSPLTLLYYYIRLEPETTTCISYRFM